MYAIRCEFEKKYWGEAVNTANYLQNRLPTKATDKTPYELWFSRKPDVKNLHVFGCEAYAHIHKEQRRKLDDKAEKLIFTGYSEESKAFRLLNKQTNVIKISRDVIFLDKIQEKEKDYETHDEIIFSNTETHHEDESSLEDGSSEDDFHSTGETDSDNVEHLQSEVVEQTMCRRSERSNRGVPPDRYMANLNLIKNEESEPRSVKEALSSFNKNKWKKAMDEEINSLNENSTWDIVPLPKDSNLVTCKWVFKTKCSADGNTERYKARLVARGFSQKYGIDYDEVFAPVVRQTTFRTFLTYAGIKGMVIKHFDAKTAFLNGKISETIYMKQPDGYVIPSKEDYVCRLNRGIYGLKQAAKIWNDQLNNLLKKYGFIESKADPCLYIKMITDK